ncbi:MAG: hypothetical protein REJ23_04140 [Brevundimonas sp.]|nr:hypothetical protein [Brevundimonas sp.]
MRVFALAGLAACIAAPVMAQTSAPASGLTPAEVFAEAGAACAADGGALWGVDLCTPVLLVDPATRTIHANRKGESDALSAEGGLFTGTLPATVNIANTAMEWDGVRWAMLMQPLPRDPVRRRALVMHERWHGVQEALGLPAHSPTPAHLDSEEGRVLMRLEWRALAAALNADGDAARRLAVSDALAFRAARRALGSGEDERALEMNEGLAEYTGLKLSGGDAKALAIAALGAAEGGATYVRSFAYASGPAYGLLLDEAAPDWRQGLKGTDDPGVLLAAALELSAGDEASAEGRYGGAAIRTEEARRAEQARVVAAGWTAKLVDGPRLRLPFRSMQIAFDPGKIIALPPHGSVYPTLRVVDVWGVLEVSDGALIDDNWSGVTVVAPASAEAVEGPGWTLRLNAGWRLEAGERAGDFRLVQG